MAKKPKRQKTNYKQFFNLVAKDASNEALMKAMHWHIDPKSADPHKRARALKSVARGRGVNIDGVLHILRNDNRLTPKASKAKSAKPKAEPNHGIAEVPRFVLSKLHNKPAILGTSRLRSATPNRS